jgi:lipoprotein Spr
MNFNKRHSLLVITITLLLTSCVLLNKPKDNPILLPANESEVRFNPAPIVAGNNNRRSDSFNVLKQKISESTSGAFLFTIDKAESTQFKYAILLNVEIERIWNMGLYNFIDQWWGTPYRMGGVTKQGIDCSGFVYQLFSAVYGLALPRSSRDQEHIAKHIGKNDMQEGDLVFFNTRNSRRYKGVSHVGVYLHNNKFVHASTSSGVIISDLKESYWQKHYVGSRRIK